MNYVSCFSGIEAASVASHGLGWEPVAFSEIDNFASAVLAQHYPKVPNLGDITKIDWSEYNGRVGLVCGGSPCQAFSLAGLRKSLEDPRGNLTLEYMRAIHAIKPKWAVWEQVPGVFSASGNPFGCFVAGLAGYDTPSKPPNGKWGNSGFLVAKDEGSYSIAWRVLCAQHFGVPQRRRRIFLVGHLGIGCWWKPLEVLLERNCAERDSSQGRKAREEVAENAGRSVEAIGADLYNGALTGSQPATLTTNNSAGQSGPSVLSIRTNQTGANGIGISDGVAHTLDCTNGQAVAIGSHWAAPENPHPTLNQSHNIGGIGASNQEIFSQRGAGLVRSMAFAQNQEGELRTSETMSTLGTTQNASGQATGKAVQGYTVRRITPIEAEFLQGFPRNWTQIPYRGKPPELCPDGPRYKALGNSWAVPVARWVFTRIDKVDKL